MKQKSSITISEIQLQLEGRQLNLISNATPLVFSTNLTMGTRAFPITWEIGKDFRLQIFNLKIFDHQKSIQLRQSWLRENNFLWAQRDSHLYVFCNTPLWQCPRKSQQTFLWVFKTWIQNHNLQRAIRQMSKYGLSGTTLSLSVKRSHFFIQKHWSSQLGGPT